MIQKIDWMSPAVGDALQSLVPPGAFIEYLFTGQGDYLQIIDAALDRVPTVLRVRNRRPCPTSTDASW